LFAVVAALGLLRVVLGFGRADRGLDVLEHELLLIVVQLLRAAAELRALELFDQFFELLVIPRNSPPARLRGVA
jgi:hypothetical protein